MLRTAESHRQNGEQNEPEPRGRLVCDLLMFPCILDSKMDTTKLGDGGGNSGLGGHKGNSEVLGLFFILVWW